MNPIDKFSKLRDDVLSSHGTRLAFFKGSLHPNVLIVGEAPGPAENLIGVPFVGRSGILLHQVLSKVGLNNFEISFLNPVFRMPRANKGTFRKPTQNEIDYYRPMAKEIISYLAPSYIILMGVTAREAILNECSVSIDKEKWIGNYVSTYHPGFILRNPNAIKIFERDIQSVVAKLQQDNLIFSKDTIELRNFNIRDQEIMESAKMEAIFQKSEVFGKELESVRMHISSDPSASIIKARKLLELMLAEQLPKDVRTLSDQIKELSGIVPEYIESMMHFIRRNGNTAAHSNEQLDSSFAQQNFEMLLSLFCWNFKIELKQTKEIENVDPRDLSTSFKDQTLVTDKPGIPPNLNSKVRFFIADPIFKTWPKIAVLSEDGILYSEYLAWNDTKIYKCSGLDFYTFNAESFRFGTDEHGNGYQPIREVSYVEAASFALTRQSNWVDKYLMKLGIYHNI